MNKLINLFAQLYDKIENYWEGEFNHRLLGTIIVFSFLFSLLTIYINIWGYIPQYLSPYISLNPFAAIEVAFVILLFFEVLSLVFTLPHSVAKSLQKQFEIISLILLRNAFKEFSHFSDPIQWSTSHETILHIFSDSFAAISIFFGIYIIRSIRKHYTITHDERDENRFIQIKKFISIFLMVLFIGLAIQDAHLFSIHAKTFKFFPAFYTALIFIDVLIILVSLRYNYNYMILFRNSGFAIATVLLRLSINAPIYINAVLAVVAVIFVFLLTLIYQQMQKKGLYTIYPQKK